MCLTARSLAHLKQLGYHARVVEKWNPFAKIRLDLFVADLLALKPGGPVPVLQATTGSNHSSRCTKLEAEGFIALWKGAGAVLEIWSWAKQGPRGQRKTWTENLDGAQGDLLKFGASASMGCTARLRQATRLMKDSAPRWTSSF